MTNEEIGKRIRQVRTHQSLSQIELAERVGISFQQIQKYEKGATKISVMRLQQISDALGIHISSFLGEEKTLKISDFALTYSAGGKQPQVIQSIDREEMAFLTLFRRIRNKKIREGIIKQLRGVVELEKQK